MRTRRIVLGAVAAVVGLPVAVILIAVVTIQYFDQSNGSVVISGETREYLLHVPGSYDGTEPTPLIISLHAGATRPAHQMNLTRWNRLADAKGFIGVYPSGTPEVLGVVRTWRTFGVGAGLEEDVSFVAELIDSVKFLSVVVSGYVTTLDCIRFTRQSTSLKFNLTYAKAVRSVLETASLEP